MGREANNSLFFAVMKWSNNLRRYLPAKRYVTMSKDRIDKMLIQSIRYTYICMYMHTIKHVTCHLIHKCSVSQNYCFIAVVHLHRTIVLKHPVIVLTLLSSKYLDTPWKEGRIWTNLDLFLLWVVEVGAPDRGDQVCRVGVVGGVAHHTLYIWKG